MSSRKDFIHGHAGYASKDVFSCESGNVHTPAANRWNLISYVHSGPSGSLPTGRHSIVSMKVTFAGVALGFFALATRTVTTRPAQSV
jgi:hypothetical protein